MGLQSKIMIPMILLIVLLVGGTGTLSYMEAAKGLEESLKGNMRGESEAAARAMAILIDSAYESLNRESESRVVSHFVNSDFDNDEARLMGESLSLVANTNSYLNWVSIADARGVVRASSNTSHIGQDFAKNSLYFPAVMQTKKKFITPPFFSSVTNSGIMVVAAPIIRNGNISGVIFSEISMSALQAATLDHAKLGAHGYGFAVAAPGMFVMHPDKGNLYNANTPSASVLKEIFDSKNGEKVGEDANGKYLIYYTYEATSQTVLGMRADYDEAYATLTGIRNTTVIVTIVAILVGLLVVALVVRPVVSALQRGVAFAQEIAAGNFKGTLNITSHDETGQLAEALRTIPTVLNTVVEEYAKLEENIVHGNLGARGHGSVFKGAFADLVNGTNGIMDRYGMVMDSIPSLVVTANDEGKVVYMNKPAQNVAGAQYMGKTTQELFAMEKAADTCTPTTISRAPVETRAFPQGKAMDISYSVIPMMNISGKAVASLQFINDLTEIKNIQRTIVEVATQSMEISDRLAAAAEELSAQSEQISNGTDVQRDRVATTATAMEEMNSTVLEVARSAGDASEQAESTRAKAQEGVSLVDQVTESIRQVNIVAQELQTNMQNLGGQAEAIGGVMNVISDIADQTNLLALNAAIEAARAGEAGRGFAVVADEVRKLAEKTMSATTEVGSSIRGIQTATTANISRVSDATQSVSQATALAGTSGAALHEILELASKNSALIASIATAAEQQSATSEEINRAVEEINHIANDTASGMAESSSAVQELSTLAQELRTLLGRLSK